MKKIMDSIIKLLKSIFGKDIDISIENHNKYNIKKNKDCDISITEMEVIMKQNNSLITVDKNNKSNININVGVLDELSCDNIHRNYNEVSMLENEFTDRLV